MQHGRTVIRSLNICLGLVLAALLTLPSIAQAEWTDTHVATITNVRVHQYSDTIYVYVDPPLSSHPMCTRLNRFAMDPATPEARNDRIHAAALTAQAAGIRVNIGYDGVDDCIGDMPQLHYIQLRAD